MKNKNTIWSFLILLASALSLFGVTKGYGTYESRLSKVLKAEAARLDFNNPVQLAYIEGYLAESLGMDRKLVAKALEEQRQLTLLEKNLPSSEVGTPAGTIQPIGAPHKREAGLSFRLLGHYLHRYWEQTN